MPVFLIVKISVTIKYEKKTINIPWVNNFKEQAMTDKKHEEKKKKKEEQDWPLPYCTTAPSAEHHRAGDEDEPCDDARATDFEEEEDY